MQTATATQTSTMTEARVCHVTRKAEANLEALVTAGHLSRSTMRRWIDDLIYLQTKEAIEFFEIQCRTPQGERFGLHYEVSNDGSIHHDARSGGIDVYGLPNGTSITLFARYRPNIPQHVLKELERRGWGPSDGALEGSHSERRAFSSEGYGLIRTMVGNWP